MSHQAQTWAVDQTAGSPGAKALLMALANAADVCGVTFVGRAELARQLEVRPGTVTDNMARLEEAGLVTREERRRLNGSRTTDWIILAPLGPDRGDMRDASPDEYPAMIAALASGPVSDPDEGGSGPVYPPGQVRFRGGPEPSVEPERTTPTAPSSSSARGRASNERKPVRIGIGEANCSFEEGVCLDALRGVAVAKGADLNEPKALAAIRAFPDRDHVGEAEAFEHWHLHGNGQNRRRRDLNRAWRTWLQRSAPASARVASSRRNGKQSAGDIIRDLMAAKEEANSGDVA